MEDILIEIDEIIKEIDSKLVIMKKETVNDVMYIYCET